MKPDTQTTDSAPSSGKSSVETGPISIHRAPLPMADGSAESITLNGIRGVVASGEYRRGGLYAKWASHTGYRSGIGLPNDPLKAALVRYRKESAYPFLVWKEGKEGGWSDIQMCTLMRGAVLIRLPQWHEGVVAECLRRLGMVPHDRYNHFGREEYWRFDPERKLSVPQVRELLRPLMRDGTRLADESDLAAALWRHAHDCGWVQKQAQASLF